MAGSIRVPSEGKNLRHGGLNLVGEAVLRVESFRQTSVPDVQLGRMKQLALPRVQAELARYRAMGGEARRRADEVGVPRLQCLNRLPTSVRRGVVVVKVVGVRLWAEPSGGPFSEFLVSQPRRPSRSCCLEASTEELDELAESEKNCAAGVASGCWDSLCWIVFGRASRARVLQGLCPARVAPVTAHSSAN